MSSLERVGVKCAHHPICAVSVHMWRVFAAPYWYRVSRYL